MTGIIILACAVVVALGIGAYLRGRSGRVVSTRPHGAPGGTRADASADSAADGPADGPAGPGDPPHLDLLRAAGLPDDGPSIVHFSAPWCGPCAAVRRVTADTVARIAAGAPDGPPVHDVELDFDDNAELARALGVMSLPTTFLYDSAGRSHGRVAGVPSVSGLTEALRTLR